MAYDILVDLYDKLDKNKLENADDVQLKMKSQEFGTGVAMRYSVLKPYFQTSFIIRSYHNKSGWRIKTTFILLVFTFSSKELGSCHCVPTRSKKPNKLTSQHLFLDLSEK